MPLFQHITVNNINITARTIVGLLCHDVAKWIFHLSCNLNILCHIGG